MERANNLGLEVLTYTVNDLDEAKRLINVGVIGITTDRPGWLKSQIY
jgi:glycerophosphoryl diester phosphodiesterase